MLIFKICDGLRDSGRKEKKTCHKEEEVGIKNKLLSLVSWQYPATLVGVWIQRVCRVWGDAGQVQRALRAQHHCSQEMMVQVMLLLPNHSPWRVSEGKVADGW